MLLLGMYILVNIYVDVSPFCHSTMMWGQIVSMSVLMVVMMGCRFTFSIKVYIYCRSILGKYSSRLQMHWASSKNTELHNDSFATIIQ